VPAAPIRRSSILVGRLATDLVRSILGSTVVLLACLVSARPMACCIPLRVRDAVACRPGASLTATATPSDLGSVLTYFARPAGESVRLIGGLARSHNQGGVALVE